MEFWGVEVKSGKPLTVELEKPRVVHLTQACLGEGKVKGNEPIYLYVTINEKKIVLGTLCPKKFPQQQLDLMFEKNFQLSHSWKNGTVNFFGYQGDEADESDSSDYGSDSEIGEDIPLQAAHGINAAQAAKPKVNPAGLEKDLKEDDDSSDGSDADLSEDDLDSDEDEGSESDSSDSEAAEETPKKAEKASNKRPAESASETLGKKAKLVTPKKTGADNKKSNVHVDTPYPSKQKAGKISANQSKQKTPESAGSHSCKPCKRSFKSEKALESHSKAKHADGK